MEIKKDGAKNLENVQHLGANHLFAERETGDDPEWVKEQKEKMGLSHGDDLQTAFDIHEADEGRK